MGLRLLRRAKNLKEQIIKNDRRDPLLKKFPKNAICAEIGVYKGKLSERILEITKPKELVLIDAWSVGVMRDNSDVHNSFTQTDFDLLYSNVMKKFSKHNDVKIIRQNSKDGLNSFTDSYFDWIYIDASHYYEDVLSDLETAKNKLKQNGILAGDDYTDANGKWGDDVIRAVDYFAKKYDLKVESLNDQFIIRLSSH